MRLLVAILFITLIIVSTHAQMTEDDGLIAFSGADLSLYATDMSGENTQLITETPAIHPAWSPDGQFIAFAGGWGINNGIYVLNLETSDVKQFATSEIPASVSDIEPSWSPDGSQIAFISDRNGSLDIFVMDGDGKNLRQLTSGLNILYGYTWSPDGQYIVFVYDEGFHRDETDDSYEEYQLYVIDTFSENPQPFSITEHIDVCPTAEIYYNPRWSQSTNQLAFAMGCSADDTDIWLMNMADWDIGNLPQPIPLTNRDFLTVGYLGLSWSPTGNNIAFVAIIEDETRSAEIIILDIPATLETGEPVTEQITDMPTKARIRGLSWQPIVENP